MKLVIKQKAFSWIDSYDVYDENGNTVFTIKGQISWGHCLKVFSKGKEVARIKEKLIALLPRYDMYIDEKFKGYVRKELTLLRPRFSVSPVGWKVKGNPWELDYAITDKLDKTVAVVKKGIFNLTDTYTIDIIDDTNCLQVVLTVLAVDIEKGERESSKMAAHYKKYND